MQNETQKQSDLIYFERADAIKYGINEAILINNFRFWINLNVKNGKNFIDGRTWSYISRKKLTESLNFLSEQKFRTTMNSLIKQQVIVKGSFNKKLYDKTTWYAFFNEKLMGVVYPENHEIFKICPLVKINQSIGENQPMDWLESTNGLVRTNQPIPDSKENKKEEKEKDIELQKPANVDTPAIILLPEEKVDRSVLVKGIMEKKEDEEEFDSVSFVNEIMEDKRKTLVERLSAILKHVTIKIDKNTFMGILRAADIKYERYDMLYMFAYWCKHKIPVTSEEELWAGLNELPLKTI